MERLTVNQHQIRLEHLIGEFCSDCGLRGMTEESIRRYRSSLTILVGFLGRIRIDIHDVEVKVLRDFLHYVKNERGAKNKTVENYFSALSAFYDYLVFEDIASSNIAIEKWEGNAIRLSFHSFNTLFEPIVDTSMFWLCGDVGGSIGPLLSELAP